MESNYVDTRSAIQVIGCIFNKPTLLGDSRLQLTENDFTQDLHRIIFSAMSNVFNVHGNEKFSEQGIDNYLKKFPESYAIWKQQNGFEWLDNAYHTADILNYRYYFNRVKKMTLLREYEKAGMDVRFILDPDNVTDIKEKQRQEEKFDKMSVKEVADLIEGKITRVRENITSNNDTYEFHAGDNSQEYLDEILNGTNIGYPLYDKVFSRVVMGCRPGKCYLRSAQTGTGKTRSAIADACYLACDRIYENGQWQDIGYKIPTLYISVEQDPAEIESMIWSFIANVPSDHIDLNEFEYGELDRVKEAIKIEKNSKLHCEFMPDYKLKDVRNAILRGIREYGVRTVFFDYICSSVSIMNELTQASGGVQVSEYQILYLMASALKDIAENFGITIITSSQLNGSARMDKTPDANVLAGAKSMSNRMDVCCVMMDTSKDDLEDIAGFFGIEPNVKLCLFKNRAGRWNRIILWLYAEKGVCRYKTIGVTDYHFNPIDIEEILPETKQSQSVFNDLS